MNTLSLHFVDVYVSTLCGTVSFYPNLLLMSVYLFFVVSIILLYVISSHATFIRQQII